MPLVKAHQLGLGGQSAIVMDLADLEREAGDILRKARAEAERVVAEGRRTAEREGETIKEQARAAGQAAGYAAGMAEGQKKGHDEAAGKTTEKLKQLVERWSGALGVLEAEMPSHLAETRVDLVKLAIAIARRATKLEAERNHEVVLKNVEAALGMVGAGRKVVVAVHPEEVEVMEKYVPELLTRMRQVAALEVVADGALTPGDAIIRFGAGEIDARLEGQVERIAEELVGEVKS